MLNKSQRRLVTLRTIRALHPIPNADKILMAEIDGWQVVVLKDEFQVGDPALYFEIDSFLPAKDKRFEFLTSKGTKEFGGEQGTVLKTVRLRGQISQGLALPVPAFAAEVAEHQATGKSLDEILGIAKYEKPFDVCLAGQAYGRFPNFLPKTSLERIQNLYGNDLSEVLKQDVFEMTLKMDGASMTIYCTKDRVGVCSHELDWKDTGHNAFWNTAKALGLPERLQQHAERTGEYLALQGELVGPKIQGNPHGLPTHAFYVYGGFRLQDNGPAQALNSAELAETWTTLNRYRGSYEPIPRVPYLGAISGKEFMDLTITEQLKLADGPGYGSKRREGLVFKARKDPTVRFKIISNEYLLHGPSASAPENRVKFDRGEMPPPLRASSAIAMER